MKKVSTIILLMTAWVVCSSFFFANTVTIQVEASEDDATENAAGTVGITQANAPLANISGQEWGGARFLSAAIPRGAKILSATLTVQDTIGTRVINATVYCQAADNGAAFTTTTNDISARTRTTASVEWDVASTGTSGEISPSFAAALQEVVNRDGWASGNAVVIIVDILTGSTCVTRSFNVNPTKAATLNVIYTRRRVWSIF